MEVFINLTKNDTIVAIDNNILPGSLVFDSLNPFPGYYHETPTSTRSIYIYMVLSDQYPLEELIRATRNIEKEYGLDFDAGKGFMSIGSELLHVIRIRHLPGADIVEEIQDAYIKQGIGFLMNKKIKGKLEARVKVVKFSMIEEVGDGIFVSVDEPTFGYVEISKYLNQEDFLKVSMDVKYNWDGHEFDVVQGSFYYNGKLYEVVRIRSNKIDAKYLSEIKKLYLQKMR